MFFPPQPPKKFKFPRGFYFCRPFSPDKIFTGYIERYFSISPHTLRHFISAKLKKMNKTLTILISIVVVLLVLFLFPGKINYSKWDSTLDSCEQAPLGGCFSTCTGKYYENACTRATRNSCSSECTGTCYGLVFGSCGVNPNAHTTSLRT